VPKLASVPFVGEQQDDSHVALIQEFPIQIRTTRIMSEEIPKYTLKALATNLARVAGPFHLVFRERRLPAPRPAPPSSQSRGPLDPTPPPRVTSASCFTVPSIPV